MPEAGLFAGEVTDSAPADEAATLKQKGYQWLEYGAGVAEYEAVSGEGYVITQDAVFDPEPSLTHPFSGESFNELTMSAVFKGTELPLTEENGNLFSISAFGVGTYLAIRRQPISFALSLRWSIASWVTPAGSTAIATGTIPIGDWTPWYWLGVSYNSVSGALDVALRNLTAGTETVIDASSAVTSQIPVEWNIGGPGGSATVCAWGTGTSEWEQRRFRGVISQELIHSKYIDLSVEANRDKFCGSDGVIDLGNNGENPFGEIPEVYNPRGFPQENLGTRFIGLLPDLYFRAEFERDDDVPPLAT